MFSLSRLPIGSLDCYTASYTSKVGTNIGSILHLVDENFEIFIALFIRFKLFYDIRSKS